MSIWYSPHPKAFLREICTALATEKEHCAVSVPQYLLSSFRDELISYGRKSLGQLRIPQIDPQSSLEQNLCPLFIFHHEDEAGIASLPEATLSECRTLVIFLPETPLPWEDEFFAFVNHMVAHAKFCKDQDVHMPWSLLLVIPSGRRMPREDIGLKVFHWWGRLHVSDLEYAIEQVLGAAEVEEKHLYYWFYALCKGLASSDPGLVDFFLEALPTDMDSLVKALSLHELNTRENGQLVLSYLNAPHCHLDRHAPPQGAMAPLWHRGILDIDCYGRTALHPAALLAAGQTAELERLAVSGQMQVFLPLAQEVHSLLYRKIEHILGPGWGRLNAENFPALDSEIGPLSHYLYTYYRSKLPIFLLNTAKHWRDLRNSIAHANMIPFAVALQAVRDYLCLLEDQ